MCPFGIFNEYSGAKYLIYSFTGISARKLILLGTRKCLIINDYETKGKIRHMKPS